MRKAERYPALPDIVKVAIEEMAQLILALSTIPLYPEVVKKLKRVREALEKVNKEYPQLKLNFEESFYEEFNEEAKQTTSNDDQMATYEPVLEQMTSPTPTPTRNKPNTKMFSAASEQPKDKAPCRQPIEIPSTVLTKKAPRPPPPSKVQRNPSGSDPSTSREPNQSAVSDRLVANDGDTAFLAIARTPCPNNPINRSLSNRQTLLPRDQWPPPFEDWTLKGSKGDDVEQSRASIPPPPLPPPFLPVVDSSVEFQQHADPPKKRDSIATFLKNTKTKEGAEKSSYCVALWNCDADADNELSFRRGDKMRIVDRQHEHKGWLVAESKGRTGLIPFNYVTADST